MTKANGTAMFQEMLAEAHEEKEQDPEELMQPACPMTWRPADPRKAIACQGFTTAIAVLILMGRQLWGCSWRELVPEVPMQRRCFDPAAAGAL